MVDPVPVATGGWAGGWVSRAAAAFVMLGEAMDPAPTAPVAQKGVSRIEELPPGMCVPVLVALNEMSDWVHRRVEVVEFVTDEVMRRRVSIDFTVPERLPVVAGRTVVPLALMRKRPMTAFDLRDEDGRPLSVRVR